MLATTLAASVNSFWTLEIASARFLSSALASSKTFSALVNCSCACACAFSALSFSAITFACPVPSRIACALSTLVCASLTSFSALATLSSDFLTTFSWSATTSCALARSFLEFISCFSASDLPFSALATSCFCFSMFSFVALSLISCALSTSD